MAEQHILDDAMHQLVQTIHSMGSVKQKVMDRISASPSHQPRLSARSRVKAHLAVAALLAMMVGLCWIASSPSGSPKPDSRHHPVTVASRQENRITRSDRSALESPPAWGAESRWSTPAASGSDAAVPGQSVGIADVNFPDRSAITDEEFLRANGFEPNLEGLASLLAQWKPDPASLKEAGTLIARLGHDDFFIREEASRKILAMSPLPLAELHKALQSTDAEVVWRARTILEDPRVQRQAQRFQERPDLTVALCRSIRKQKLQGAVPLLLNAIPSLEGPRVLRSATDAVVTLAKPGDTPLLRDRTISTAVEVRVAAIRALGRVAGDPKAEVGKFLTDAHPAVALAAAEALAERGEREALPALARLAANGKPEVRERSVQVLRSLTGNNFGLNPYLEPGTQTETAARWRRWVEQHGRTAPLRLPLVVKPLEEDLSHGLLLHYTFDADANGRLRDRSGHRRHGIVLNKHRYVPGRPGRALWVEGTGDMGDRGGHARFPFINLPQCRELTVSLWVREEGMSDACGEAYLVIGTDRGVGLEDSLGISHFNAEIIYRVGEGVVRIPFDPNDRNRWVHYAMTYSGGVLRAYRDGKPVGQQKGKVVLVGRVAALGRHWWHHGAGDSARFIGAIDDVRIYDRALSPDLIQMLGTPVKSAPR